MSAQVTVPEIKLNIENVLFPKLFAAFPDFDFDFSSMTLRHIDKWQDLDIVPEDQPVFYSACLVKSNSTKPLKKDTYQFKRQKPFRVAWVLDRAQFICFETFQNPVFGLPAVA